MTAHVAPPLRLDSTRLAGDALRVHVILDWKKHCELQAIYLDCTLRPLYCAAFLSLNIRCSTLSSRFNIWSIRSGKAMNS